ncbi:MAG: YcxB family protein [Bacillota bacterium]|nr:YcxB family protein [Bacillota bacterium]
MEGDTNNIIAFSSKLQRDDYLKANKVILKIRKKERKLVAYLISIPIITIAMLIGFMQGVNNSNIKDIPSPKAVYTAPWYISYLPTLFIIFMLIAFIVLRILAKRAPKRHYDSNKLIQEEMRFVIDDSSISYTSEKSSAIISWDEIYKIYMSKEFLVIFISNRTVWIIPKKNIGNSNIYDLTKVLSEKMDKKKLKIVNY